MDGLAFDPSRLLGMLPLFGGALLTTLGVFLASTGIGTVVGLGFALLEKVGPRPVAFALGAYSWFFRSLPELIVLLFCYLVLPQLGLDWPATAIAILGLACIGTAYDYEIFRGGFAAVGAPQYEAARALGLPRTHMYRRIILPQMLRVVLPSYVTYACGALKRTAIVSAISVTDIMGMARLVMESTQRAFEPMVIALLVYILLSSILMAVEVMVTRRYGMQLGRRVT
ncbi:amino acid ABC transporter permease [Humitalea sp. 24SJ18S-53]|uniref:amino acid ABC transporter permease n=1 Tax=Humitalea sp. 24SJ18S-53 TaxID=3422307 RepID=UPI003D663F38